MKIRLLISSLISAISIMNTSFIHRLFQEPQHSEYKCTDSNMLKTDVEWISHKVDSENIKADRKNLNLDMNVSIEKYKTLENG